MKLKTIEVNGTTYAEVRDGHPVYLHDDGKEIAFDAPHAVATIKRVSDERDTARKAAEGTKAFEGIDPEKARKALEVVKNLDDKKLIEAGKVDELVKERLADATKAWDGERQKLSGERDAERAKNRQLIVGRQFAASKYLTEQTVLPPSAAEALFGGHFKVDGDKPAAYDGDKPLYSRAKPGEQADFDEALAILIERHPDRDRILKGSGSSGAGAGGSTTKGGGRSISRAAFDALPPKEAAAFFKAGGVVTD